MIQIQKDLPLRKKRISLNVNFYRMNRSNLAGWFQLLYKDSNNHIDLPPT